MPDAPTFHIPIGRTRNAKGKVVLCKSHAEQAAATEVEIRREKAKRYWTNRGLPARAGNALANSDILDEAELRATSPRELGLVPNLGATGLRLIREFLGQLSPDGDGPQGPLWRADDKAETVALRIFAQLSLGKARAVHAELGRLIGRCEAERRDAASRGQP